MPCMRLSRCCGSVGESSGIVASFASIVNR